MKRMYNNLEKNERFLDKAYYIRNNLHCFQLALGLSHFKVSPKITIKTPNDRYAECYSQNGIWIIWFNAQDIVKWTEKFTDKIMTHELLHIRSHPIRNIAAHQLAWKIWNKLWDNEESMIRALDGPISYLIKSTLEEHGKILRRR